MANWTLEPADLAVLLLAAASAAACRVDARRRTALVLAVALLAVALVSPLAAAADERSLALHMVQHTLLWDVAPIAFIAAAGRLPPGFPRSLTNPLIALPLWLASLAFWHLPRVFDAALRHGWLHGLQHAGLFAAGLAMWAPVLGVVPVPAWFGLGARFAYVAVMQLAGLAFANVLLWWGSPLYTRPPHPLAGTTALTDQRVAGGVVLVEGSLVVIAAFAWLFLRLAWADEPGSTDPQPPD